MSSSLPMLLVMLFDHVAKLSNSRSQMFFKRGVLNTIQDGGWGGGGQKGPPTSFFPVTSTNV